VTIAPPNTAGACRPGFAVSTISTPLGNIVATVTAAGVEHLQFCDDPATAERWRGDRTGSAAAHLSHLADELAAYFAGDLTAFTVPLAPAAGTPFQLAAWAYLRSIPFAQTRTYGQQATAIGAPNASRAVGGANGANPLCLIVPCHRVVGADGSLTGFAAGIDRKRWLLDHERRACSDLTRTQGRPTTAVQPSAPI
jgi:O-6-methylguanine DNA methyltransferase